MSGQPPQAPDDGLGSYVYAVVDAGTSLPDGLDGLDGAPLRTVVCGEVAAVVADVAVERPPGRRADLMAHSQVVDTLAADLVVVPVQFGSLLPDDESVVEDFLRPNEPRFLEYLESLDGRTQFTLRATYHEETGLAEIVHADPEIADLRPTHVVGWTDEHEAPGVAHQDARGIGIRFIAEKGVDNTAAAAVVVPASF